MTGCYFAFCDETERTTSEIMVVNFGRYFVRSVEMPKKGKCIGQQRPAVYLVLPECSFFIFLQCQLKRELSADTISGVDLSPGHVMQKKNSALVGPIRSLDRESQSCHRAVAVACFLLLICSIPEGSDFHPGIADLHRRTHLGVSAGLPCLRLSHLRLQVGTLVITLNVLHPAGCRRQVADRDCGPSEV